MSDLLGHYLNEIGKIPLLELAEERKLSEAVQRGIEARTELETAVRCFPELAETSDVIKQLVGKPNNSKQATPDSKKTQKKPDANQLRRWRTDIRKGDAAREKFVTSNLRLVVSIAKRYPLPSSLELMDLIQEGNIGLEYAVNRFDGRKGFRFSTYATFWIRQSIGRALDHGGHMVHLPEDKAASLRSEMRHNRGDTESMSTQNAMLHKLAVQVSLDNQIGEDGTTSLGDMIADPSAGPDTRVHDNDISVRLRTLVSKKLSRRDIMAIEYRLGLYDGTPRSYNEVGKEIGTSAEAARRIVNKAFGVLRQNIPEDMLDNYPDLKRADANRDSSEVVKV